MRHEMSSVGMVETSSIARGYETQDAMLKVADVQLVLARTICSGKYVIVVGGTVADVEASVSEGVRVADDSLIDHFVIPNVHPQVFGAISGTVDLAHTETGAMGIVEAFSAASIIEAADAAVKAADVTLFRVHLAMAIGGKGFLLVAGDVSAVRAATASARQLVADRGLLVHDTVITGPRQELFQEYV